MQFKYLFKSLISVLLGMYLRTEFPGQILNLAFWGNTRLFSAVCTIMYFHQQSMRTYILIHTCYFMYVKSYSHPSMCEVIAYIFFEYCLHLFFCIFLFLFFVCIFVCIFLMTNAGKDWRQEEKGTKEDEMVGWHQWLNGLEFEQALRDGERWASLAYYSPWSRKELDMI